MAALPKSAADGGANWPNSRDTLLLLWRVNIGEGLGGSESVGRVLVGRFRMGKVGSVLGFAFLEFSLLVLALLEGPGTSRLEVSILDWGRAFSRGM